MSALAIVRCSARQPPALLHGARRGPAATASAPLVSSRSPLRSVGWRAACCCTSEVSYQAASLHLGRSHRVSKCWRRLLHRQQELGVGAWGRQKSCKRVTAHHGKKEKPSRSDTGPRCSMLTAGPPAQMPPEHPPPPPPRGGRARTVMASDAAQWRLGPRVLSATTTTAQQATRPHL